MCVGLLRPVILLPTEENCPMTPGQRRASLAHELAHLSHLDDWVGLLAELWRSVSWFYPPVHWTLGRLYLEREARCDEIASRHLESPECYARWLLDLAPIKVRPPVLASSLLGGTDLAARIRRLLDGRPRPSEPMTRLRRGLLAVLAVSLLAAAGSVRLVGFAARAGEAESPDAPLPEITREALAEQNRRVPEALCGGTDRGRVRGGARADPVVPDGEARREHHVPRAVPVCQRRPPVAG